MPEMWGDQPPPIEPGCAWGCTFIIGLSLLCGLIMSLGVWKLIELVF